VFVTEAETSAVSVPPVELAKQENAPEFDALPFTLLE
jgi:hypothetical protein